MIHEPLTSARASARVANTLPSTLQGAGLGLRTPHLMQILRDQPDVPWFELLADNWLAPGGALPQQLEAIRANYPITFHCVGMSLGGTNPMDFDYLRRIRDLADRYEPIWISDHLCFTGIDGHNLHDLLPLPFTTQSLRHLADRIGRVQDFLGRRILVENVSSYLSYADSTLEEADFVAELVETADCDLLLDINNVYVNAINLGLDAQTYLKRMPLQRIREVHLGGHEVREGYLLDAHNHRVSESVWALYAEFIALAPATPTLIEWDKDIPAFEVLLEEAALARSIQQGIASESQEVLTA